MKPFLELQKPGPHARDLGKFMAIGRHTPSGVWNQQETAKLPQFLSTEIGKTWVIMTWADTH